MNRAKYISDSSTFVYLFLYSTRSESIQLKCRFNICTRKSLAMSTRSPLITKGGGVADERTVLDTVTAVENGKEQ